MLRLRSHAPERYQPVRRSFSSRLLSVILSIFGTLSSEDPHVILGTGLHTTTVCQEC
jgi:hypothetical protein